jgi:hypothetical protein
VVSPAFVAVEKVGDVDDRSFTIPFDRARWVNTANDEPISLADSGADLPGLSGCPVFARRDLAGIGILEFVGTVLSEIPYGGDGVRVRSSRCLRADGTIERE